MWLQYSHSELWSNYDVTCNVCKKNMTNQEIEDYHVYDVKESKSITLCIIPTNLTDEDLDICEECKARAMLISIIRRWNIASKLYKLFITPKDDVGMDTFIKKIIRCKWGHSVNWIGCDWIRK